jgi:NAD(P)-dependent dehydrogenase (short-subunit alcohol dehydrogenase family)
MTIERSGGRSAVVTGGGTGIGYSIAEMLVRSGHNVTIIGRRRAVLEEAAQKLRGISGSVSVLVCDGDLAEPQFPAYAIDKHIETTGRLDVLVGAAGIYENVHTLDMTVAVWDRIMNANVRGNALAAFAAAQHMTGHGGGRIVLIGSVLMDQSEPRTLAYSASKAALASVVRSMAVDLSGANVHVNGVAPGWVLTAMGDVTHVSPDELARINPQRRAANATEIADVVRFLLLEAPRFLSGQMVVVDGGQTILGATL